MVKTSKSNLSNIEQKELSKLSNDETIVIKPESKGKVVVILSTGHYQSMILYLLDENTQKNLDSSIDDKILEQTRQTKLKTNKTHHYHSLCKGRL